MSVFYVIDPIHQRVISRAIGALAAGGLRHHYQQLRRDPAFHPTLCELWDCTGVTAVAVSGIRQLATVSVFAPGTPRAMVAPSDAVYGLSRMLQTLRGFRSEQIAVFRDRMGALAWLEEVGGRCEQKGDVTRRSRRRGMRKGTFRS